MIGHFEEKVKISIQFQMMWMKIKKFQRNMKKFGKVLKKKLKRLMVTKELNMEKTQKNRLESNDDLPMNKPIKLRFLVIIIRCVFSEVGKLYPQLFLVDAFYELV